MPTKPFKPAAIYIPLTLLAALAAYWCSLKPPGDYANYFYAPYFFRSGQFGSWVYDPFAFNQAIQQLSKTPVFSSFTPVPPITVLCLLPFTWLHIETAKGIMEFSSFLLFLFSMHRLFMHEGIPLKWLPLLLLCLLMPLRNNFYLGQTYFLVLFLLTEGYLAHVQAKKILSAVCWSLAILLKIFPGILLLYLLLKKDYRQVCYIGIISITLILLSNLVLDNSWQEYLLYILPRQMAGEINNPFSSSYQSFSVLLRKILLADSSLNPDPWVHAPRLMSWLDTGSKMMILLLCASSIQRTKSELGKFGISLFCGLLISGYGTNYGLLLCLFLLLFFLTEHKNKYYLTAITLIFLACNLPVYKLFHLPLLLQFVRLYLMLAILICILLQARIPARLYLYISLLAFIPAGAWAMLKPGSSFKAAAVAPSPVLLSYAYQVSPGGITLLSFDQDGYRSQFIPYAIHTVDSAGFYVSGKNIYLRGQAITQSRDQKKAPLLINGNELFYLSDHGRGAGFYQLVKEPFRIP